MVLALYLVWFINGDREASSHIESGQTNCLVRLYGMHESLYVPSLITNYLAFKKGEEDNDEEDENEEEEEEGEEEDSTEASEITYAIATCNTKYAHFLKEYFRQPAILQWLPSLDSLLDNRAPLYRTPSCKAAKVHGLSSCSSECSTCH